MSAKSGAKPTLNYYPYSPSPCYQESGNSGCGGNGAVIGASIVLIILLVLVVVGGIWYWNCGGTKEVNVVKKSNKKQVSFSDSIGNKQLQECSEEILADIMTGKSDKKVIAFVAPWCGHCQALKPVLEEAAKESNVPILTLTHIDDKQTPHVGKAAAHLKVQGFPMLFLVENGKAVAYNGDRSKQSIIEFAK